MAPATHSSVAPLPLLYSAFFLYIEPVSTLVGAVYAHFLKQQYMDLTLGLGQSAATIFPVVTTREDIVLTQLVGRFTRLLVTSLARLTQQGQLVFSLCFFRGFCFAVHYRLRCLENSLARPSHSRLWPPLQLPLHWMGGLLPTLDLERYLLGKLGFRVCGSHHATCLLARPWA